MILHLPSDRYMMYLSLLRWKIISSSVTVHKQRRRGLLVLPGTRDVMLRGVREQLLRLR